MASYDLWLIGAAVMGVGTAFERHWRDGDGKPATQASARVRLLMLACIVGEAAWNAETLRGFLYLTLMPLGAYKAAQVLAEPIAEALAWRRVDRARVAALRRAE